MPKLSKKKLIVDPQFFYTFMFFNLAIIFTILNFIAISFLLFPRKQVITNSPDIHKSDYYAYWMGMLDKYPNYFPANLELCKISLDNKNTTQFEDCLLHAKKLNPNSIEIRKLEGKL